MQGRVTLATQTAPLKALLMLIRLDKLPKRWKGWRARKRALGSHRAEDANRVGVGSDWLAQHVDRREKLSKELIDAPLKVRLDVPVDLLANLLDDAFALAAQSS
jgi:hypothetical protein